MADVREMRIFSADQIHVPEDLPQILKEFNNSLTDLSLVFYKTKIPEEGFHLVCSALAGMQNLTNLVLTFGKTIEYSDLLAALKNNET